MRLEHHLVGGYVRYISPHIIIIIIIKHKRISQVSKNIQSGACAFTMNLYCCVMHLLAITAGELARLSLCLTVSSAMK